jgi:hypothetical protein
LERFAGIQYAVGVTRQLAGFVPIVSLVRVNDSKIGHSHIHHDPAGGADVSGTLGFDKDNTDVFERIHLIFDDFSAPI